MRFLQLSSLGNSILSNASTVRTVFGSTILLLLLLQPVSAFGTATGIVFAVDHGDDMEEEEVKDNPPPTCGEGGALGWDNISNKNNNNNEWWNPYSFDTTSSSSWDNNIHNSGNARTSSSSSSTAALPGDNNDWSLILWLLWSALHRLLNEMVHAWLVPLYTLSVVGYWMWLHGQQFWKRRRQRKQQQLQQEKQQERTALVSVSHVEIQPPPTLNQRHVSHDMDHNNNNDNDHAHSMINLSGLYQLIRIENLDAFLAAQGVPWPLRKAASKVMPRHEITHTTHQDPHQLTIRIDAGPIQTRTTYQIGAGSVETEIRGRVFRDNVNYLKDRDTGKVVGVVNEKTAVTEGYQITVSRRLSDDRKHIFMESVAYFPKDPTKEPIVSTQLFERVEQ